MYVGICSRASKYRPPPSALLSPPPLIVRTPLPPMTGLHDRLRRNSRTYPCMQGTLSPGPSLAFSASVPSARATSGRLHDFLGSGSESVGRASPLRKFSSFYPHPSFAREKGAPEGKRGLRLGKEGGPGYLLGVLIFHSGRSQPAHLVKSRRELLARLPRCEALADATWDLGSWPDCERPADARRPGCPGSRPPLDPGVRSGEEPVRSKVSYVPT